MPNRTPELPWLFLASSASLLVAVALQRVVTYRHILRASSHLWLLLAMVYDIVYFIGVVISGWVGIDVYFISVSSAHFNASFSQV